MEFDGFLQLLGPVCSDSAKLDLIDLLSEEFSQTGLCPSVDCDTASINVDCILSNVIKRSVEPVHFNVTFSIRNNE
jgi:hypothetical protein